MDLGIISLVALIIAVIISMITEKNIGLLAIVFAFLIAMMSNGEIKVDNLLDAFPLKMFMMLVGVTYLFTIAQDNGSIAKVAQVSLKFARGNVGMLPIIFFLMAVILSAVGPGNIAATVVLAPIGMAIVNETKMSPLLMTLMIVNGANAGALSPFAPTGIIANGLAAQIGIVGLERNIFLNSLLGNGAAAALGYFVCGGHKLWKVDDPELKERVKKILDVKVERLDKKQASTLIGIVIWIILVMFFKWDVGFTALTVGVILSLLKMTDEEKIMRQQPWFTMFMLVGVMLLVEVASQTGGLDYAVKGISAISNPNTISLIFGFIVGFISIYSGSSAVVMPTFIPLIPGIVAGIGVTGAAALEMQKNLIYVCCVSAHLVDASPLSLLGALCVAQAPAWVNKTKLFRQLLLWGVSMSVFAALISFLFWR